MTPLPSLFLVPPYFSVNTTALVYRRTLILKATFESGSSHFTFKRSKQTRVQLEF